MTASLHDWLSAAAARPYDDVGSLARVYLEHLPRCTTPAQLHGALRDARRTILDVVPPYSPSRSDRAEAVANAAAGTQAAREQAWRTVTAAEDEAVRLWRGSADPAPPVPASEHEAMRRVQHWRKPWPLSSAALLQVYAYGPAARV